MKLTDDTDSRVRKCYSKVCKVLDKQGVFYNKNQVFRMAIVLGLRNFSVNEIADSFICGHHELRAAAELN